MIYHSIRWRVQAWHGLMLVLVLAGFGWTAWQMARDEQARRIDRELEQRLAVVMRPEAPARRPDRDPDDAPSNPRPEVPVFAARVQELIQRAGSLEPGQQNAWYYVLWDGNGRELVRSPAAPAEVPVPEFVKPQGPRPDWQEREPEWERRPAQAGPPGPGFAPPEAPRFRTRGDFRELIRFMPRGGAVLAGHSLVPENAAMRQLALWLTAAGTGVLLLGLAGGWWVSSRAIRPIEHISAAATRIADGDLSQRIDIADTDSELGRLAAVLNSTFARLEASFANQARFTSDASHELRTPVSVILSQTQTALARERPASEYRESLEACRRAAQRMRHLTESLLELARLDAGEQPVKHGPVDLSRVAHDCVELLRPLVAERKLELRCELASAQCLGDADRLGQVVTNLITNAIHFNNEGGWVEVSTTIQNGLACLTVKDGGPGIPAEDLPHIFERFYRVDKSRSRAQGHAGLGLAICKAIVDAHAGRLEALSRPGEGATFTVSLPAA
jgi:two-component system, OmpR family, sensor kinase